MTKCRYRPNRTVNHLEMGNTHWAVPDMAAARKDGARDPRIPASCNVVFPFGGHTHNWFGGRKRLVLATYLTAEMWSMQPVRIRW